MNYKECFDTRVDFPHHYESIGQKQEYEVVTKTEQFDPVEYEQFKKYLEFQKEKEILEKYEREGWITSDDIQYMTQSL